MITAIPEILKEIIGFGSDEKGAPCWVLTAENPTREEREAFSEFLQAFEQAKKDKFVSPSGE